MKTALISILILFPLISFAQRQPRIASGRPGQAIGPLVVGTGVFQVQTGVDYDRREFTNTKNTKRTLNNVIRFGLSEDFELSSVIDYRDETFDTNGVENNLDGVSQFQLGFRYNLIPEADGWIPAIGFQTRFQLKQVGSAYKPNQVTPVMLLVTGHQLTKKFSLNLNGGMSQNGVDNIPIYNYVVSLSQEISSIFSTVYEAYGNEYDDNKSDYLGFGVAYRMNNDTQLDVYLSSGNNAGVKEFYFTVGISWRTFLFNSLK